MEINPPQRPVLNVANNKDASASYVVQNNNSPLLAAALLLGQQQPQPLQQQQQQQQPPASLSELTTMLIQMKLEQIKEELKRQECLFEQILIPLLVDQMVKSAQEDEQHKQTTGRRDNNKAVPSFAFADGNGNLDTSTGSTSPKNEGEEDDAAAIHKLLESLKQQALLQALQQLLLQEVQQRWINNGHMIVGYQHPNKEEEEEWSMTPGRKRKREDQQQPSGLSSSSIRDPNIPQYITVPTYTKIVQVDNSTSHSSVNSNKRQRRQEEEQPSVLGMIDRDNDDTLREPLVSSSSSVDMPHPNHHHNRSAETQLIADEEETDEDDEDDFYDEGESCSYTSPFSLGSGTVGSPFLRRKT